MTQTRRFVRVEVTMKREGTKTGALVSGGSAHPTGRRAARADPPHPLSPSSAAGRPRGSSAQGQPSPGALLWMASSCHLLNTFYPLAHSIPAALLHQLGQEQRSPAVCVGRPWPPRPSSCRNPRQPQGRQPCLGRPGHRAGGAPSPEPPPESNQGFRKERWPSQKAKSGFFACSLPQTHSCGAAQGAGRPPRAGRGSSFAQSRFRFRKGILFSRIASASSPT